jgi:hypothetical protein
VSTLRIVVDRTAFRRIVCAVDSSTSSNEPVHQAVLLSGSQTELSLIAVARANGSA